MPLGNPPSARPMIRVLVVDDHRLVAEGLRLVLDRQDDILVVGIAADAAEAFELTLRTEPDVLLADYRLPDESGTDLAMRIRERRPGIRVLMLSMVSSSALLQDAVRSGARAYLLKTEPAQDLVDAVRRVAAGEMLIPVRTLAELMAGTGDGTQLVDRLTTRERDVLQLLSEGLDNRDIAARLGIGYGTVRSHLRNLSTKFGAHSKLEILARGAELGLIVR